MATPCQFFMHVATPSIVLLTFVKLYKQKKAIFLLSSFVLQFYFIKERNCVAKRFRMRIRGWRQMGHSQVSFFLLSCLSELEYFPVCSSSCCLNFFLLSYLNKDVCITRWANSILNKEWERYGITQIQYWFNIKKILDIQYVCTDSNESKMLQNVSRQDEKM